MTDNENDNFWIQRKMPGTNSYIVYWKDYRELGMVREHAHTQMRFHLHLRISQFADSKHNGYGIYDGGERQIARVNSLHEAYNIIPVVAEAVRQSQTLPITHKDNPVQKYWKSLDEKTIRDVLCGTGNEYRSNMNFAVSSYRSSHRFSIHQLERKVSKLHNLFYNMTMLDFLKIRHWVDHLEDYFERHPS